MKKFIIIFSIIVIPILAFLGYQLPQAIKTGSVSNPCQTFAIQQKLQQFHPIQQNQNFVILILAENAAEVCERQLKSIFDQTYSSYRIHYIDNGSNDQTFEKAEAFCAKEEKLGQIQLERFEEKKPETQIIYNYIHMLDSKDVVLFLRGQDWLAHENVLDHLNCSYANPEVWLTYSRAICHPDYQKIEGSLYSDNFFEEKKFRETGELPLSSLTTFYASFFNEIHMADFLFDGRFIDERAESAFLYPLFEMGCNHVLFMDEVMLVKNNGKKAFQYKEHLHYIMALESYVRSLKAYPSLTALRQSDPCHYKGDVLIFSEDNPLHLYACLESLFLKVEDLNDVYVIYKSYDTEFGRAYLNLKNEFPAVQFLDVCDYPGNDFASLLNEALANKRYSSPFLLITDDQKVFDEKLKLHECIEKMEKTRANYFFVSASKKEERQKIIPIDSGIYAKQFGEERTSNSPFMCICLKDPLAEATRFHHVKDLAGFKSLWNRQLSSREIALYYEETKTIPLHYEREIALAQKKEWGRKFIEGYKIDLPSLLCGGDEGKEGDYPLIKRERRKLLGLVKE